jgi:hypothetical protein
MYIYIYISIRFGFFLGLVPSVHYYLEIIIIDQSILQE